MHAPKSITGHYHQFRPHQYLAREGEMQDSLYIIQEGWAVRYRLLPDGRRQVTGLYLPGDICQPEWALGDQVRQPIIALTPLRAEVVPCDALTEAGRPESRLLKEFWGEIVASLARQTEWIINLGRKTALERLSHLFCELFQRLQSSGLTHGTQFAMPLTQTDLADLTGLTPVHVNRMLQSMRAKGLIDLKAKWLWIHDLDELGRIAHYRFSQGQAT